MEKLDFVPVRLLGFTADGESDELPFVLDERRSAEDVSALDAAYRICTMKTAPRDERVRIAVSLGIICPGLTAWYGEMIPPRITEAPGNDEQQGFRSLGGQDDEQQEFRSLGGQDDEKSAFRSLSWQEEGDELPAFRSSAILATESPMKRAKPSMEHEWHALKACFLDLLRIWQSNKHALFEVEFHSNRCTAVIRNLKSVAARLCAVMMILSKHRDTLSHEDQRLLDDTLAKFRDAKEYACLRSPLLRDVFVI